MDGSFTASTAADDTVHDMFHKEHIVGSTYEKILEKPGGEPEYESDRQRSQPLHCCVNAVRMNLVDHTMDVVCCIGERFSSLVLWVVSFCCRPSSSRPAPPALDKFEAGETERSPRSVSGLAPSPLVTLVNQKIPVGSSGDFSCVGNGVDANPADSLANATVHPPDRITADPVEVVRPPAPDTVVADDPAATATVNLGDSENPIDVGVLSRLDFELILAVCPYLA